MGMFDTVLVTCPKCGIEHDFQSKSGPRLLRKVKLSECPDEILEGVNRHAPSECQNCLTKYEVYLQLTGRPVAVVDVTPKESPYPKLTKYGIKGDDNLFETGIFNGLDTIIDSGEMKWLEGRAGEWICIHGVGHGGNHLNMKDGSRLPHGCCHRGCCGRLDYPGRKRD